MSADPVDRGGDTKMALIKKLRAMVRERDGELSHLRRRLAQFEGAGSSRASPSKTFTFHPAEEQ